MKQLLSIVIFIILLSPFVNAMQNERDSTVILQTKTGNIEGSLLIPSNFRTGELVILISGSGPTDRDGNNPMMKNNSLKMLAYHLADSGFAVLRFDKRGIAASKAAMVSESLLRFDDYVADVVSWIGYMRSNKRFKKITIAGHSEGSLIGMLAAKENADRFISIAGSGRVASEILREQLAPQPDMVKEPSYRILDSLQAGVTVSDVPPLLQSLFRASVQPYLISWFKYNPQTIIHDLAIPVLICQGTKDLQVGTLDAQKLAESNKKAMLHLEENMNHVLKIIGRDLSENQQSYANPDLPVATGLINAVIYFLRNN